MKTQNKWHEKSPEKARCGDVECHAERGVVGGAVREFREFRESSLISLISLSHRLYALLVGDFII